MPEDIELGVTLNTDQAVDDLESDLEQADTSVSTGVTGDDGGSGVGAAALGAEAGSDVASGSGKGGILGGLAGGVSKLVGLIGIVVAFLALLEPVQQALGFIARQFELLLVPVLTALRPLLEVLQKGVVKILDFFRNPSSLLDGIKSALAPFANAVIGVLNNLPGVDISRVDAGDGEQTGFRSSGQTSRADFFTKRRPETREGLERLVEDVVTIPGDVSSFLLSDDGKVEKNKNEGVTQRSDLND